MYYAGCPEDIILEITMSIIFTGINIENNVDDERGVWYTMSINLPNDWRRKN